MVKKPLRIIWDKKALEELEEILEYISKESRSGAQIVKTAIVETIKPLKKQPTIFSVDVLKENNDGSYRAFTVYSYRISYKVTTEEIIILRVRHTSREPLIH